MDFLIAESTTGRALVAIGAFFAGAGSLLSGLAALRTCKKGKEVKDEDAV